MSLTAITTPSSPAGAFDYSALKYEWADQYVYTAKANSGGSLQLTVSSATALEFTAGDFIWVSALVDYDLIDSPIVDILSVGATTITVNVSFNVAFADSGTIRGTKALNFILQTGFSVIGNAIKQRVLQLRPDPNGIYAVNPYQEVISRFNYREPVLGDSGKYDHAVRYRVYPQSAGSGTWLYAFKNNTGSSVGSVIRYSNVPNIVSYIPSGGVTIRAALESATATTLAAGTTVEQELTVYFFDCVDYVFSYDSILGEEFFTYDVEPWVSIQASGSVLTGFTFNFSGQPAGEYSWTIAYDDGAKQVLYSFTIYLQNTIDCRPSCGGRRFFWWGRKGGWSSYEFSLSIINELQGGTAQLKQVGNQVSAVRYERQHEVLTLLAKYEGAAVYDYLREMLFSLNVYEATTFSDVSQFYDLYFKQQASGQPKSTQPFLATSNRFTIDLTRGNIEERINEGR